MARPRARAFILVWGVWTLLALLWTGREILLRGEFGTDWERSLFWNLFNWYVLGSLTPLVIWLTRCARLGHHSWPRVLFVHIAGLCLFTGIAAGAYVPLARIVAHLVDFDKAMAALISGGTAKVILVTGPFDAIIYAGIVSAAYAVDYSRRYRERELLASQLEAQLAQAQLQVLKTQLHPHFLFNALNAISALVQKDSDAADRMIARLADLLRHTLRTNGNQEVTLQSELALLEKYIEIQKARFQDRLDVHYSIDPDTLDLFVPNLILQPIVENAIRHGISDSPTGGQIEIRASRSAGLLTVEVMDNGCGFRSVDDALHGEGVGLANTRVRLQRLYGGEDRLVLKNDPSGGAVVRLSIPIREGVETGRSGGAGR